MFYQLYHFREISLTVGNKSVEDVLFEMFEEPETNTLSVGKFLQTLAATGLRKTDPRLKEMIMMFKTLIVEKQEAGSHEALMLNREQFRMAIRENIVLISRALRHHFVIPEFVEFTKYIEEFYWKCKVHTSGKVASYIPQLSKFNPGN